MTPSSHPLGIQLQHRILQTPVQAVVRTDKLVALLCYAKLPYSLYRSFPAHLKLHSHCNHDLFPLLSNCSCFQSTQAKTSHAHNDERKGIKLEDRRQMHTALPGHGEHPIQNTTHQLLTQCLCGQLKLYHTQSTISTRSKPKLVTACLAAIATLLK